MELGHMGTGNLSTGNLGTGRFGMEATGSSSYNEAHNTGDALEVYFECITTCSLDDGACVTRCVEQLREHP
jgi:hypothetical protein